MSNYTDGRRAEYKIRDLLRESGYVVMRTAGSKSPVDLIAVKPRQLLFVQVKRSDPPGPAAWNALFDLAADANAVPVLATCIPRAPVTWDRLLLRKPAPCRDLTAPFVIDFATTPGETPPC